MQATDQRTTQKTSRLPIAVAIIIMVLLAVAAVAYYLFFAGEDKAAELKTPEFSAMPTDATGNNLTGNITENLSAGGFIAEQGGWIYFSNFADGGSLYMCREGGEKMVKLTDFPVANINILADSLVFTGIEKCVVIRLDGVYEVKFDSVSDLINKIRFSKDARYGGRLCAVYGLHSGAQPKFNVIDGSNTYFSPYLDKEGLFGFLWAKQSVTQNVSAAGDFELKLTPLAADYSRLGPKPGQIDPVPDFYAPYVEGQSLLTNKMTSVTIPAGNEDETVVKQFVRRGILYAEMFSKKGSRIVRFDLKSLQPIDEIGGKSLLECNGSLVFIGTADGFVYEINPDDGKIYPLSVTSTSEIAIGQTGDLILRTESGVYITVSKENRYERLFDRLRLAAERVILQKNSVVNLNGWYNYLSPELNESSARLILASPPGFFRAGDRYYYLDEKLVWTENGELVEWLNRTPDLKPLSTTGDYAAEYRFKPAWMPEDAAKAQEGLDATQDFGNETKREEPVGIDATKDPRDALYATIMLMRNEDFEASGYTPESIEAIRSYSGGDLEEAVSSGVDSRMQFFTAEIENAPDAATIQAIVEVWLSTVNYQVGGASLNQNGDVANVTLTTSDAVDTALLPSALQREIDTRMRENPEVLTWPWDQQTEWAAGVLLDVMSEPQKYDATDKNPVETVIIMRKDPVAGWVADDIRAIAGCFIRGPE